MRQAALEPPAQDAEDGAKDTSLLRSQLEYTQVTDEAGYTMTKERIKASV